MNTGGVGGHGGGGPTYQNHLFETAGDTWPPEAAELRDWELAERRQHWDSRETRDSRPHQYRETRETREAREAREWMMAGGRHGAGEPVYDQWRHTRQPRHAYTGGHTRVSTIQCTYIT